jgi:hypothetical protein
MAGRDDGKEGGSMKRFLLLPGCLAVLLLASSCSEPTSRSCPAPSVTDTKPLGDGIKTLAYAFLGASVVLTLGRLLR